MKKNQSPAAPVSSAFWRPFALLSLVANVALLAWLLRIPASTRPLTALPVTGTPSPVSLAATKSLPRELTPYASLGSFMAENNRVPDLKWTG